MLVGRISFGRHDLRCEEKLCREKRTISIVQYNIRLPNDTDTDFRLKWTPSPADVLIILDESDGLQNLMIFLAERPCSLLTSATSQHF